MLSPDTLLERIKLKRAAALWRMLFFVILAILIIILGTKQLPTSSSQNYIARITIDEEISQNIYNTKNLQKLLSSNEIKAVILNINSPGGTAFAGEDLYSYISKIVEKKPVVTVIKTIATSAAYMIASPSDYIVARNNSLTGSIGAVVFSPDASKLLDKLGIKINTIKLGALKAEPLPYKQMDDITKNMLFSIVEDNYSTFLNIVLKHRNLSPTAVIQISNSRIFTGKQAHQIGLIDAIGGEEEALLWLKKEKKIANMPTKDFVLKTPQSSLKTFLDTQILSTARTLLYNNLGSYTTMYK
ncbi:MAG: signal peptide peptidase SppA [Rickettsiales bacterium]|nr:signal peptide peptidase SppA [Rickettsiales bacterium]